MINKNELNIDYDYDVIEDIKIIDYECWMISFEDDKGFWAERIVGIAKVISSPYPISEKRKLNFEQSMEREIKWCPFYINQYNYIEIVNESSILIYGELSIPNVKQAYEKYIGKKDYIPFDDFHFEGKMKNYFDIKDFKKPPKTRRKSHI